MLNIVNTHIILYTARNKGFSGDFLQTACQNRHHSLANYSLNIIYIFSIFLYRICAHYINTIQEYPHIILPNTVNIAVLRAKYWAFFVMLTLHPIILTLTSYILFYIIYTCSYRCL